MNRDISHIKTIMIKVGSSSLCTMNGNLDKEKILNLVLQISKLKKEGYRVVLVSSGAIAAGMGLLHLKEKPTNIPQKQALAAIGQAHLMQIYEEIFALFQLKCAQVLLNHGDFDDRHRLLNLDNTIHALMNYDVIPIINENDALAVEEIKVGDNDTLAALMVPVVDADLLILVSDIDGLYTHNPRVYKDAQLLKYVEKVDDSIMSMAQGTGSQLGSGGMYTKLKAAKIVNEYGKHMVIVNGNKDNYLLNIFNDHENGTWFNGNKDSLKAKAHWLAYRARKKGKIIIDEGAKNALRNDRKSLLPKGIVDVEGHFLMGQVVSIETYNEVIGKGIVNYSSEEIKLIKGLNTNEIENILHYKDYDEVIHANNMILKR
jgi:glutamate 5-kinase